MRFTTMLSAALKMATATALGLTALGVSVAAGAATETSSGTWEAARPFPGFSASNATLQAITCPSLGNCVAVGYTSAPSTTTPIVSAETNGVWGSAQVINGTGSLGNGSGGILTNVSCGGPGDCTATGTYPGTDGVATAFYVSETAGTWGTATAVTSADQPAGTYSQVSGLSCGDVGYCAIVGRYTDQGVNNAGMTVSIPFTLDEAKGTWGTPQPVPGLAGLPQAGNLNTLDSVSCTGASDCTASGKSGGSGLTGWPFAVSETGGTWGNAEQLPGMLSANDTMISCPDPADCAVAATYLTGNFTREIFTSDEANGTWSQSQLLAMPSSETDIDNNPVLGCRSAGNCVILGNMDVQEAGSTTSTTVPFAATETSSGTWGTAATLPGNPASMGGLLQGLSCVPGGDCTIAVTADDSGGTPYVYTAVSSADGSIGGVQKVYRAPGSNIVYGLSCPQNGHCTLAAELDYKYMLGTETTASTLTLNTPASVQRGKTVSVSGTLTLGTGYPPAGTQVTITRTLSGTTTETKTLTTGANGAFSFTDSAPPAYGTYTYTASYAGDSATAPATTAKTVLVTGLPTALKLTTNATNYSYDAKVTATAHLGTTYTGRTVTIYEEPIGGTSKKTLVTAKVNSSGNLTATYNPTVSTTLGASFGGDAKYAPVTVTRNVYVAARVSLNITGNYTTAKHGSVTYKVFHHTAKLTATVTVAPNKSGECVELAVQEYYSGAWHDNVTTNCGILNSSSKVSGQLPLTDATGGLYRIRADYLRSGTDKKNLNADSGWSYFSVVK